MAGETDTTTRLLIGKRCDLPEGTRRIVSIPGHEIGVIVHDEEIYAYRNLCAHQGGPVCEGLIIGRVKAHLDDGQRMLGEYFSESEPHLVCPWHGVEYLLKDGRCATNPRLRLRSYEVVIDDDDNVYLMTN